MRRFLEHWGDGIDTIVIVVANPVDLKLYQRILPLYFPRTRYAAFHLLNSDNLLVHFLCVV